MWFEGGFFSAPRRDGAKLAYLEAYAQIGEVPRWVVQCVSSGIGAFAAAKAAREFGATSALLGGKAAMPRIVCVQEDTCAPMCRAFADGSRHIRQEHVVLDPTGLCRAAHLGDPSAGYPFLYDLIRLSKGMFVSVTGSAVRSARSLLRSTEGRDVCYSAAASIAGVERLLESGTIRQADSVLIMLTGGDRSFRSEPTIAATFA